MEYLGLDGLSTTVGQQGVIKCKEIKSVDN